MATRLSMLVMAYLQVSRSAASLFAGWRHMRQAERRHARLPHLAPRLDAAGEHQDARREPRIVPWTKVAARKPKGTIARPRRQHDSAIRHGYESDDRTRNGRAGGADCDEQCCGRIAKVRRSEDHDHRCRHAHERRLPSPRLNPTE